MQINQWRSNQTIPLPWKNSDRCCVPWHARELSCATGTWRILLPAGWGTTTFLDTCRWIPQRSIRRNVDQSRWPHFVAPSIAWFYPPMEKQSDQSFSDLCCRIIDAVASVTPEIVRNIWIQNIICLSDTLEGGNISRSIDKAKYFVKFCTFHLKQLPCIFIGSEVIQLCSFQTPVYLVDIINIMQGTYLNEVWPLATVHSPWGSTTKRQSRHYAQWPAGKSWGP
jgi:hypothetical protein